MKQIRQFEFTLTNLLFKHRHKYVWFTIFALILWRGIIFLLLPYAHMDGPWLLSQTFSLLRGELFRAVLGFSYQDPFTYPYFYAILTAPAFLLLPFNQYNIFIFSLLLALILAFQVYWLSRKKAGYSLSSGFILIIGILTSVYTYGLRPELLLTILMVLVITIILFPATGLFSSKQAIYAGVLSGIIGLSHPMAGIVIVTISLMMFWEEKISWKFTIINCFTTLLMVIVFYVPVILMDAQRWWYYMFKVGTEMDSHAFSWTTFAKFFSFSPVLFIPPFFSTLATCNNSHKRNVWLKEVVLWGLIIGLISFFGRSYYFYYLVPFIIWRLIKLPTIKIPAIIIGLVLCIAPFLTHYTPTIQLIENPKYSRTLHDVLDQIETYKPVATDNLLWVSSHVVMPVMEEPGARIFFKFFRRVASHGMEFSSNDVILFIHPEEKQNILKNLDVPESSLTIREIIAPVPGLLRPGTFFQVRDYSLGLWEIRLTK